jgi:hypothetical protein
VQTDHFSRVQPRITNCWKGISAECRRIWEKYYWRWYYRNYRKLWQVPRKLNFWSKLVYKAAKELGFDLETLSMDNWLPEIETLEDLIKVANFGKEGLTTEELKTKIFYHGIH